MLMGQFATHGGLSRRCSRPARLHRPLEGRHGDGSAVRLRRLSAPSAAPRWRLPPPWPRSRCPSSSAHGYSSVSTATLAAAGTLGILIPPSVPLVIYAVLTQQNIGKLFMAAVIPGLIAMIGYMLVISMIAPSSPGAAARRRPRTAGPSAYGHAGDLARDAGLRGRHRRHLRRLGQPDRSGLDRSAATAIARLASGGMRGKGFMESIFGTAHATGMIFLVLLGADVLNSGLALTQLPTELAAWVRTPACRRWWCCSPSWSSTCCWAA